MAYRVLTTSEDTFPMRDPSVAAMRDAYAVEVRAGHKAQPSREALCAVMGWPPSDATEKPLSKDAYVVAMATVLFPASRDKVGDGATLHVPEVLRAASDFFAALS